MGESQNILEASSFMSKSEANEIYDRIKKGAEVSLYYVREAISSFKRMRTLNSYLRAIELAKRFKLREDLNILYAEAVDYFTRMGYYGYAIDLAKEAGMTQRLREIYYKAIDYFQRFGYYVDALKIAQEAGLASDRLYYRTIKYLMSQREYLEAIKVAREWGNPRALDKIYKKIRREI